MRKILFLCVAGVILLLFNATTSQALSIGFNPVTQDVNIGNSANVEVVISGLGNLMPDSLSAFDLDVSFDPLKLGFNSISFGDPVLGDQVDLSGFIDFTPGGLDQGLFWDYSIVAPGIVNFFEISLDFPWDLDMFQADTFTLATLSFDTLALGISSLDLSVNALGDAWGDPLSATTQSGNVNVVPEPATILLLGGGLAGIGYLRRKRKI